jgi:hypothetical protein
MTTASKAVAGGIAANLVTVALWLLSLIPGWEMIPMEPKAAMIALVSSAIGAAFVYYAPANARKVEAPEPANMPLAQLGTLDRPMERPS